MDKPVKIRGIDGISYYDLEQWFGWNIWIDSIPRLVSVTLDFSEPGVIICTNTGGTVQDMYKDENERLRELNSFSGSVDDAQIVNYTHWYYRIPGGSIDEWKLLCCKTLEAALSKLNNIYIEV